MNGRRNDFLGAVQIFMHAQLRVSIVVICHAVFGTFFEDAFLVIALKLQSSWYIES